MENILTDTLDTWYQPVEGSSPVELVFELEDSCTLGYLVLKEAIQHSQRIEAFQISPQIARQKNGFLYIAEL